MANVFDEAIKALEEAIEYEKSNQKWKTNPPKHKYMRRFLWQEKRKKHQIAKTTFMK